MNVILLGLLYSEQTLNEAKKRSKTTIQMAPHLFQTNLIKGFESAKDVALTVYNVPPVGSFPTHYKRLFMPKVKWGKDNVQPSFLNLPWIKRVIQTRKLYALLRKKLKSCDTKDTAILMYHTFEPFLRCAKKVKRKFPDVEISLIMTDPVPGRDDRAKLMSPRAVKKGDRLVSLAKSCDSFVLLTEHMTAPIEVGDRPYTVVECICNESQAPANPTDGKKSICLYTGTVDEEYGIKDFVKAFLEIQNAELWICGGGDSADYLRRISEEHEHIKFCGFVDQARVSEMRNACDFLINPRRPSGTYTKYSFPSKTAEYMMTEKPVIMYKLEGIPDEYDEYLNYLTAETPSGIQAELENIFASDYTELRAKAQRARRFMLEQKTSAKQAERILKLFVTNAEGR